MDSKVLAGLVARVLETGDSATLSEEDCYKFYRDFESDLAEKVEEMRSEKRRAYEELKNIAVR